MEYHLAHLGCVGCVMPTKAVSFWGGGSVCCKLACCVSPKSLSPVTSFRPRPHSPRCLPAPGLSGASSRSCPLSFGQDFNIYHRLLG